jgi:hypothetical protein
MTASTYDAAMVQLSKPNRNFHKAYRALPVKFADLCSVVKKNDTSGKSPVYRNHRQF